MTREESVKVLSTVVRNTATDCDYAYDYADYSVEIVPGADIAEALGMAIDALREQEERRWIPVTERLPENDDFVLVIVSGKAGNITLDNALELASFSLDEGWILEMWPEWKDPYVTYWQPLPEPPKEV